MNLNKAVMLKTLEQNDNFHEKDVERIKEFIRAVLYGGVNNRLYQNLKQKSSMPLPPDPDSGDQTGPLSDLFVDTLFFVGIFSITI